MIEFQHRRSLPIFTAIGAVSRLEHYNIDPRRVGGQASGVCEIGVRKEAGNDRDAMHRDRLGLPVSTVDGKAAARYRAGVDLHMSGNPGGEAALREAAEADPGFALALAALTMVLRDTGRRDEAKETAERARSLATHATRREEQHVAAIGALADGDGPRAFESMREHLAEFRRDALILLGADRYLFYSGGENRQQLQFELLDGFAEDYDDDWWFPGQYGFALGECGHYERAVGAAQRSLSLNPKNLWAAHTLAHVYADTKDDEEGAAFLGPWLGDFDPRAPMFGHTSWHLALFELGRGRHARAMEIYRAAVRPAVCKHRSTLNNSASFLWRCMVWPSLLRSWCSRGLCLGRFLSLHSLYSTVT